MLAIACYYCALCLDLNKTIAHNGPFYLSLFTKWVFFLFLDQKKQKSRRSTEACIRFVFDRLFFRYPSLKMLAIARLCLCFLPSLAKKYLLSKLKSYTHIGTTQHSYILLHYAKKSKCISESTLLFGTLINIWWQWVSFRPLSRAYALIFS